MVRLLFSILVVLFLQNLIIAQSTYFNLTYNPNNTWAIGSSIIEYNGSYYITGGTYDSIDQNQSIFIGNIDVNGNLAFWKTYGAYSYAYWSGYTNSLISSSYGDLILAGGRSRYGVHGRATYYNFNLNGDTNFTIRYPDYNYSDYTMFNQCRQTSDNGLIFVGFIAIEQNNSDVLILKTDYNGQEEWRANYNRPATYSIDHGYNIIETSDGGYLIGMYYYFASVVQTGNPFLLKVNSQGEFQWELNLGGPYEDLLVTVCESNDGNYMCAASISDSTIDDLLLTKVHITKVSPEGAVLWSKTVGDQHLWNIVHGIYPDHNDGYILCGYRHDDVNGMDWMNSCGWICKIDENGDSIWWREYEHFDDPEWHMNKIYDLHLTSDGGYVAVGQTATVYDPQQAWLLKVDSFGCDTPGCQTVGIIEPKNISKGTFLLYPNPASAEIRIDLRSFDKLRTSYSISDTGISMLIYDLFGRKQDEIIIPKGQSKIRIDISSYHAGIYVAVLKSERKILDRKKFVVSE